MGMGVFMRFFVMVALVMCLCVIGVPAAAVVVHVPSEQSTIQAGIDAAGTGDIVLVAPGTYTGPGNYNIGITIPGITLASEAGADETTIDCQGEAPAIRLSDDSDTTSVISGFTFTGGVGDFARAGAIYFASGGATVRDCVFRNNESWRGGAVKVWGGDTAVIERCVFADNYASQMGGAIASFYSTLKVRDCVFERNVSGGDGGAIWTQSSNVSMLSCTLVGNSGTPSGGLGFDNATIPEVLIARSVIAFSEQGVAMSDEFTHAEVLHCCIFANAGGDSLPDGSHDNMFEDPRFCDMPGGELTLCADSPCLVASPENPWGVLIGALGEGCGACGSPVAPVSWGRLKGLYHMRQ